MLSLTLPEPVQGQPVKRQHEAQTNGTYTLMRGIALELSKNCPNLKGERQYFDQFLVSLRSC